MGFELGLKSSVLHIMQLNADIDVQKRRSSLSVSFDISPVNLELAAFPLIL